jgi:hypothetical protein
MAVDTFQASTCPNVFDAGLPSIAYDHLTDREDALRVVATAHQQAPIAMGPHAPEVLTYGLVRTVLRDARFSTARGLGLRPHTDPGTRSAVVVRPDPSAPTARHRTRFRPRNADPTTRVEDYSCHPGRRLRHWDANRPDRW